MPERQWSELLADPRGPSLPIRILRAIGLLLVIAVGIALLFVVRDFNHDQKQVKKDVIAAGQRRLDRSLEEQVKTQTLICLAHPEIHDRAFSDICASVLHQWQVNAAASP